MVAFIFIPRLHTLVTTPNTKKTSAGTEKLTAGRESLILGDWPELADKHQISSKEKDMLAAAFELAIAYQY